MILGQQSGFNQVLCKLQRDLRRRDQQAELAAAAEVPLAFGGGGIVGGHQFQGCSGAGSAASSRSIPSEALRTAQRSVLVVMIGKLPCRPARQRDGGLRYGNLNTGQADRGSRRRECAMSRLEELG